MARKAILPQTRRHVLLYDKHWDWLTDYAHYIGKDRLTAGTACREIIRQYVDAQIARGIDFHDERQAELARKNAA